MGVQRGARDARREAESAVSDESNKTRMAGSDRLVGHSIGNSTNLWTS